MKVDNQCMILCLLFISFIACNSSSNSSTQTTPAVCDLEQAMNKMLALNKVQSRVVAQGGDAGATVALSMAKEFSPVSELIAQEKYQEACVKADELAAKYKLDLASEQETMVTYNQLAKDGGKGSGDCSVAQAAQKQMDVHAALQAQVDAGKQSQDIFRQYGEDTKSFGELLSAKPSEACALLESLEGKYGLD